MNTGLLHDGLAYWARCTPDKAAVVLDGKEVLTYAELAIWSDGVAARLIAEFGVSAGDTIAITGKNSLEWIVGAFAILKAGATIVPVNDRYTADEIDFVLTNSEARAVLADAPRATLIAEKDGLIPLLRLDDIGSEIKGAPAGWVANRVSSDATAIIIFTSGTTSKPKGVMLAHDRHLAKYLEMTLFAPELGPDTRSLMPLGLQSGPGTAWGFLFATTIGGTLHFVSKYDAQSVFDLLTGERITFFIGVPMIYDQIARLNDFSQGDLSALEFARVGGAAISSETMTAWRERGVVVRNLYGMSEMGGGAIIASKEEALIKPQTCGRGMPFTRLRTVREDGTECQPGEPGQVFLNGPGMMLGYWRNPEATEAVMQNGWIRSGDIGVIDEDGYFSFVGRSKEMIKAGGFNVSPVEIENLISSYDGVIEVSVFAVPDKKFDEVPCACIYAKPQVNTDELFEFCRERLAGFKLPRYIIPLPEPLPRLSNGKPDKLRLKSDYADVSERFERLG